jgi:hypothetical protein
MKQPPVWLVKSATSTVIDLFFAAGAKRKPSAASPTNIAAANTRAPAIIQIYGRRFRLTSGSLSTVLLAPGMIDAVENPKAGEMCG